MIGEISKRSHISAYQPTDAGVVELTQDAKKVYATGEGILNHSYRELNNYSIIERMNVDQMALNSYVDENADENEAWKWRGTRGIARTKAMVMHSSMTTKIALPMTFAQNDKQEIDKGFSMAMRDILEWMSVNSEYRPSYILTTMGALANPVTYLGAEFCESMQTIKDQDKDGKVFEKEIVDEVFSGFQTPVYSADQILITNAYVQNIQKQRAIAKRQSVEYSELKAKWNWHKNWKYVQAGVRAVFNAEDGLFYDISDSVLRKHLVEEVTFECRTEDTEVVFLNGIYMGDEDTAWNPIKHRDNRGAPKYNIVPFGYQRINEHFFFYKSLMNVVGWDNALIDAMYENTMNRDIIDLDPPVAISGADSFDSDVIIPGGVFTLENPDAEIRPVLAPNRVSGYQAIREIEESISEATISKVAGGALPDADQKAYNVARAEQNTNKMLKGSFRSTAESVMQYGYLMVDIALQHLTTAQVDEITGAESYRPFVLQDQTVNGKKVSKTILFDESLSGARMSKEEQKKRSLKLLEKVGYPKNQEHIYMLNPHLFSKMKYLIRMDVDMMLEKNEAFEQQVAEKMYTLLRQDPYIQPEALVRELANASWRGRAEDFMADPNKVAEIMNAQAMEKLGATGGVPAPEKVPVSAY